MYQACIEHPIDSYRRDVAAHTLSGLTSNCRLSFREGRRRLNSTSHSSPGHHTAPLGLSVAAGRINRYPGGLLLVDVGLLATEDQLLPQSIRKRYPDVQRQKPVALGTTRLR